ncbi:MAG: hypothetical protein ACRBC3_05025 [Burkholderiaceae bacterium]
MNRSATTQSIATSRSVNAGLRSNLVSNGSPTRRMGVTHSVTPVFSSVGSLCANRNRLLINAG